MIADLIRNGKASLRKIDAFYGLQSNGDIGAARAAALVFPKDKEIGKILAIA